MATMAEQEEGVPRLFHRSTTSSRLPTQASYRRRAACTSSPYCDNWMQSPVPALRLKCFVEKTRDAITSVESKMLAKKRELDSFKSEYVKAKAAFEAAEKRVVEEMKELDKLESQRIGAYLELAPAPEGQPLVVRPPNEDGSGGEGKAKGGGWSLFGT